MRRGAQIELGWRDLLVRSQGLVLLCRSRVEVASDAELRAWVFMLEALCDRYRQLVGADAEESPRCAAQPNARFGSLRHEISPEFCVHSSAVTKGVNFGRLSSSSTV